MVVEQNVVIVAEKLNYRDNVQHLTKTLWPYLEILLIAFGNSVDDKVKDELDQEEDVDGYLDAHPAKNVSCSLLNFNFSHNNAKNIENAYDINEKLILRRVHVLLPGLFRHFLLRRLSRNSCGSLYKTKVEAYAGVCAFIVLLHIVEALLIFPLVAPEFICVKKHIHVSKPELFVLNIGQDLLFIKHIAKLVETETHFLFSIDFKI